MNVSMEFWIVLYIKKIKINHRGGSQTVKDKKIKITIVKKKGKLDSSNR